MQRQGFWLFPLILGLLAACGQGQPGPSAGIGDPSAFTATATSTTSITLVWSAVEGATGYRLERKADAGSYSQIAAPGAGDTSYADGGLSEGATYSYRIKALNAQGESAGKEISASTLGAGPNDQPGPFTVTGMAVDTQGRPIPGAKVELEPAMHKGPLTTHTDENGVYTFANVPDAPYYVNAWLETTYNGQDYCLRLGMPTLNDYDVFNPKDGVVRDFQWQLTGKIADYDEDWYFGGWVVLDVYGDMRGGAIELTFTPTGPLIDGSVGSSFTQTLDPKQTGDLYDVPAGPYTVTATLIEPGGARTPLGLKNDDTYYEEATEQAAVDFDPAGSCNYSNGLSNAALFIYSPYDFE